MYEKTMNPLRPWISTLELPIDLCVENYTKILDHIRGFNDWTWSLSNQRILVVII